MRNAIDCAVAFKRVGYGDVPHELVALAHDEGDAVEEIFVTRIRRVSND